MARNTGAVCRKCRREGMKLFLKGGRCDTSKCAFDRRQTPPGMHGMKRGKPTDYAIHLREKQKVKNFYGVLEKQFRRYFDMADRSKGNTGTVLMSLLERRLDNVVFRLGFSLSRSMARQWVAHGHILVNDRFVNVASYLVRPGDVVTVKKNENSQKAIKNCLAETSGRAVSEFLVRTDDTNPRGVVMRMPLPEDVSIIVQSSLIVELCSK